MKTTAVGSNILALHIESFLPSPTAMDIPTITIYIKHPIVYYLFYAFVVVSLHLFYV